jgi:hypothetical protein
MYIYSVQSLARSLSLCPVRMKVRDSDFSAYSSRVDTTLYSIMYSFKG